MGSKIPVSRSVTTRKLQIGEHSSAVVVASLAALSALFYFFSMVARDSIARDIGLAGAPGPVSIQQAMTEGAVMIMRGSLLTDIATFLAISFAIIFLAIVIFALAAKKKFEQLSHKMKNDMPHENKFDILLAMITLVLVITILFYGAQIEGLKTSASIFRDVNEKCQKCMIYETERGGFMGVPALQTDSNIYVVGIEGTRVIPLGAQLTIRFPSSEEMRQKRFIDPTVPIEPLKKAGPRESEGRSEGL